ncbi:GNAT family N-acetyltransferase [Thermomonas fusca]
MIREAQIGDLDGLKNLYSALRPQDPPWEDFDAEHAFRNVLESGYTKLFVADSGDKLTSTCMLAFFPNFGSGGRPIGVIEHVITLPEFRGQGLARGILAAALEYAWGMDCCKVFLLSGSRRTEAHRLYESLGFCSEAERGFVIKPPTSQPMRQLE